jgi:hypothetical protein
MIAYKKLYYYLEGTFDGCEVSHVSGASNNEADTLANIGYQCLQISPVVFLGRDNSMINPWTQALIPKETTCTARQRLGAAVVPEEEDMEPVEVMMVEITWM